MGSIQWYRAGAIIACALFATVAGARDYYFAVKGGVSLGSYEAGYNWEFINYIRGDENRQLKVVSGSSAGAINALASVLQYCGREETTATENHFYRIWNMDIADLLPDRAESRRRYTSDTPYFEPDPVDHLTESDSNGETAPADSGSPFYTDRGGLFTRRAFDNILEQLNRAAKGENYRDDCEVSFTISVTKFKPSLVELQDGLQPMKVARHVIPLRAQTQHGRLNIYNDYTPQEDDRWNQKIYLPTDDQLLVPFHHVLKAALASSAFPLALSPVDLLYCPNQRACEAREYHNALFSDGGLFDNAPVGAATERLMFRGGKLAPEAQGEISVHYLNPAMLRGRKTDDTQQGEAIPAQLGMEAYMGYIFEAMDVGMSQELYRARKMLKINNINIYSSHRRYPLASNFHAHFSGFYSQDFRVHDYLVGVYGAVQNLAMRELQDSGTTPSEPALAGRVEARLTRITQDISRQDDVATQQAATFLWFLFDDEFSVAEFKPRYLENPYVLISLALRQEWSPGDGHHHHITEVQEFAGFISNLDRLMRDYHAEALFHTSTKNLVHERDDWMGSVANRAYSNLLSMQAASAAVSDGLFDKTTNDIFQVSRSLVEPYLFRMRTGYWPSGSLAGKEDSFSLYYGFDISESAQVATFEGLRLNPGSNSKSWLNHVTLDLPVTYHYLSENNESDHYLSVTPTFKYHRNDVVWSSLEIGYDHSFAGDIYQEDSTAIVLGAGFVAELLHIKVSDRLQEINDSYSGNTIRAKTRWMLEIDLGRVVDMVLRGTKTRR